MSRKNPELSSAFGRLFHFTVSAGGAFILILSLSFTGEEDLAAFFALNRGKDAGLAAFLALHRHAARHSESAGPAGNTPDKLVIFLN
jgi:hypothetical protein